MYQRQYPAQAQGWQQGQNRPPPGAPQYGQPAGAQPPYGQPPAGGYGQQPGQQPYGGAPPAPVRINDGYPGRDTNLLFQNLQEIVQANQLHNFFPDPNQLRKIAEDLARQDAVQQISQRWDLPIELAMDLNALALYDIVFLLDDSGSMAGKRQRELERLLADIAYAGSLFDQNGFSVRFLNGRSAGIDHVKDSRTAEQLVKNHRVNGRTPLRERFDDLLQEFVYEPRSRGTLKKPIQFIIITDGEPTDNSDSGFQRSLRQLYNMFNPGATGRDPTRKSDKSIVVQIAQVGMEEDARKFLEEIDHDTTMGDIVDCTSSLELEQEEATRANRNFMLTKEIWYVKMLMGAINSEYDCMDDRQSKRAPGGAPPAAAPAGGYQPMQYPPAGGQQPYGQSSPYPPTSQPGGYPPTSQAGGYPPSSRPGGYPPTSQPGYPPTSQPPYGGGAPPYGAPPGGLQPSYPPTSGAPSPGHSPHPPAQSPYGQPPSQYGGQQYPPASPYGQQKPGAPASPYGQQPPQQYGQQQPPQGQYGQPPAGGAYQAYPGQQQQGGQYPPQQGGAYAAGAPPPAAYQAPNQNQGYPPRR